MVINMSVKIARIKAGLTQSQVAKKCNMSLSSIVKLEKGDYDFLTLGKMKKLSEVLEVSVQELFFSEE